MLPGSAARGLLATSPVDANVVVDPNHGPGETRQAVRAVLERNVSTADADESAGDTSQALVTAAAAGDRAAMRDLLVAVAPVVARAVRRVMGRGHPDVDDVA